MATWEHTQTITDDSGGTDIVFGTRVDVPDIPPDALWSIQVVTKALNGGTAPTLACQIQLGNNGTDYNLITGLLPVDKVDLDGSTERGFIGDDSEGASKAITGISAFKYLRPYVGPGGTAAPSDFSVEFTIRAVWRR